MLNYLKERLADIQRQQQEAVQESVEPTDAEILEYASLFSELDDLTENGSRAATAVRTPVSIPLENDFEVELNTVEMNVSDGRVTDIPADATVTEAFEMMSSKYTVMKTRDDFVQEAYAAVSRMPRESNERYQARVDAYVHEQWSAYNQYITQEGLFGHDKVDLNDAVVPDKVTIDFGPKTGAGNYMVTIPVKWETDKKQRVTRKQIDSVGIFQRMPADIWGEVTDNVMKAVTDKYNVDGNKDKWDVITPVSVIVPIDPADQYAIIVEFDTDCAKEPIYWRLMLPVKAGSNKSIESAKDLFDGSPKCSELFSQANRMDVMRKRDFKLEFAQMQRPSRFGNRTPHYYTEGIDFGGGAATPDAAPPPEMAGATPGDAGPTVNVGGAPDATAAAPTDAAPAPDAQQVTMPAAVNDVSNDIAQNVAAQTQADDEEANADIDINVDDVDADVNADLNVDNVDAGTDSQLDSIDDVDPTSLPSDDPSLDTTEDTGVPDMSNVDMDNMTVDQLIAQGAEKLKGMTLNQLKEFLNSPEGTSPEDIATESYMMLESFFTRDDNVRKRIDTSLNDVIKGFKKIAKGIEEDDWDRTDFMNFWHANARVHRNQDNSSWDDPYSTAGTQGAYFAASVSDLQHYLKIAVKKKRARGAFTDDDRKKLTEFNDSLKKYVNDADDLSSITGKRHDVDITDVLTATKRLIGECEDIKSLVTSKKFAESYVFEAAVITKKNVKSQIQEHIKSALGILNNTEFNFRELVEAFRKEGKALNKALTKAMKMKKLFTPGQLNDIDKLNSILVDLQSNMRLNALNEDYTKKVKGLITNFAQQCKVVNDSLDGKVVQEVARSRKYAINGLAMGGLAGWLVGAAVFGPTTFGALLGELIGMDIGMIKASVSDKARDKQVAEFIDTSKRIIDILDSKDSSESVIKELKTQLFNLLQVTADLQTSKKRFPNERDRDILGKCWDSTDSFRKAIKKEKGCINQTLMKVFLTDLGDAFKVVAGEDLPNKEETVQEVCGPDTDPANCASANPQSVNEEDESMSYSGNNSPDDAAGGGYSDNPADGADVGGVDFESEGVQREERVRKATGVATPKYTAKIDDSIQRGQATKQRLEEEKRSAEQNLRTAEAETEMRKRMYHADATHDKAGRYVRAVGDESRARDAYADVYGKHAKVKQSLDRARNFIGEEDV